MTSLEFIEKEYCNDNGKSRYFASIYKDGNGNIYSYGTHYPLLFRVSGLNIVNTAGYSMTTAKHIGWAHRAANYDTISVELTRDDSYTISASYSTEADKRRVIMAALDRMSNAVEAEMAAKKRKDTAIYAHLQARYERINQDFMRFAATARYGYAVYDKKVAA